jgi:hypothetical protein
MWSLESIKLDNSTYKYMSLTNLRNRPDSFLALTFTDKDEHEIVAVKCGMHVKSSIIQECNEVLGVENYTGVHNKYLVVEDDFSYRLNQHITDWKIVYDIKEIDCRSVRFNISEPYAFYLVRYWVNEAFTLGEILQKYPEYYIIKDNKVYLHNDNNTLILSFDTNINRWITKYNILERVN